MPDLPLTRPEIEQAAERLSPHLPPTPLLRAPDLDTFRDHPLWLKAESLQRTGSFKARGALNWLLTASDDELANGLITVSAGNHAMALAWAGARRQVPVTVVMPEGASPMKVARTRELGGHVILHGGIQEAVAECHRLREEYDLTLVHPYNDLRVMAGQGTVGLELLEQQPDLNRIVCPIGGGGLISGLGVAVKAVRPDITVIGVEPAGAGTMRNAWQQQDATASLSTVTTWAGSLAPAVVGEHTYRVSRAVVDDIVTVSEAAIVEATRELLTRARLMVEPGAAVGLAALLEDRVPSAVDEGAALIITGGNADLNQIATI
ncbi:threonine dehydratase [Tamilnaduibacter salinus]|uniref:Threonine dehydratase n=1 Tax=Tamilnaduibacter salinus TaxID=1484056 RepID=A0A2U1CVS6_9GAMM|nr:threonine/serine dehydratase [Tamilnaduibacter salinus]PVY75837.1 threonine dehydratase [Tamilnaduibacter salinus]